MNILNNIEISKNLESLPHRSQIAFAGSCCERLVPNYLAFSLVEGWGDVQIIQSSLDKVWAFVAGANISMEEINSLVFSLRSAAPDTEDFDTIYAGLAVNLIAALIYTLSSINEANLQEMIMISQLSIESIETYLFAINDPHIGVHSTDKLLDEWIQNAPLLISEIEKQINDLNLIKSWKGEFPSLIQNLRQSSKIIGIQPVYRRIIKKPS